MRLNFLGFGQKELANPIKVDLHSHLLPGIDDGVKDLDESMMILSSFEELGYEKVITTPHIMGDYYKNDREIIESKLKEVRAQLEKSELKITIDAAAEYYLDDYFMSVIGAKNNLLLLGENYVLMETAFLAEQPVYLKEAIFQLQSGGYKVMLAHPERYEYLMNDWSAVEDLKNRGVYFQLNLNSLVGYYSPVVKSFAMKLIKKGTINFVGSDCHNARHFETSKSALKHKNYQKLLKLQLLNNTL